MKAKDFALVGVYTALLIGGQFALSFVAGIEIVTVLFVAFAFHFGHVKSLLVANAFCVLRCFVFGFFPSVIVLYLIYYNLLVLVFAFIGKRFKQTLTPLRTAIVILVAAICTICFTLIDDVITPLFYSFDSQTAYAYFITSLYTMATQTACTLVTVTLIFPPLNKLFCSVYKRKNNAKNKRDLKEETSNNP